VYACDRCRASKKKCDGKAPCTRCWKTEKECSYTAPTAGQVFPAGGVVQAVTSAAISPPTTATVSHMNNAAISRRYFDMFNMTVKPMVLMDAHYDYQSFVDLPSQAKQLQYYAIMASMNSNFAADHDQSADFLQRARHLSADLLDDFQLETAKGFHLMAFHYWGKDADRMSHYRDITLSVCRRILARSSPDREDAIRLYLVTLCLSSMDDPTMPCEVESLVRLCEGGPYCRFLDYHATRQAKPPTSLPTHNTSLSTAQLYLWVHFQAEMGRRIFHWANRAPAPGQGLFRPLSEDSFAEMLTMLGDVSNIMIVHTVESPYLEMGLCMGQAMYSVIYYAGGRVLEALKAIENVVHELNRLPNFAMLAGPFFISLSHWMFLMAFVERKYALAQRLLDIQVAMSLVSPPILPSLHANMERLRSLQPSLPPSGPASRSYPPSFRPSEGEGHPPPPPPRMNFESDQFSRGWPPQHSSQHLSQYASQHPSHHPIQSPHTLLAGRRVVPHSSYSPPSEDNGWDMEGGVIDSSPPDALFPHEYVSTWSGPSS